MVYHPRGCTKTENIASIGAIMNVLKKKSVLLSAIATIVAAIILGLATMASRNGGTGSRNTVEVSAGGDNSCGAIAGITTESIAPSLPRPEERRERMKSLPAADLGLST